MLLYPAIFTQGENYITVTFPDLPEAITQGKDLPEAYDMAVEVLGLVLEDYADYPAPSQPSNITLDNSASTIALIGIDMLAYRKKYQSKKVRKNVTIPEWLNDLAEERNINFSQVLAEALELKLQA